MQESDYGQHLFGYMVTGLMSEEWYHWSIHSGELSDYSPQATCAFRDWLQDKYKTVTALRAAWCDPFLTFDTATISSQESRQARRNRATFRNPALEMPVIDWYLFYNDLVPDTMEVFLRAAKEASDFGKVVAAFYCYMFEFGGDPEYGHNAMARLLRSKHLDFAIVNPTPQTTPEKNRPHVLPGLVEDAPVFKAAVSFVQAPRVVQAVNPATLIKREDNRAEITVLDVHEVILVRY